MRDVLFQPHFQEVRLRAAYLMGQRVDGAKDDVLGRGHRQGGQPFARNAFHTYAYVVSRARKRDRFVAGIRGSGCAAQIQHVVQRNGMQDADGFVIAVLAPGADAQEQVHLGRRDELDGAGASPCVAGLLHGLSRGHQVHRVVFVPAAVAAFVVPFVHFFLLFAKKVLIIVAHSSASTPGVASNTWFSRASWLMAYRVPNAPALPSEAPYTQRSMRA